MAAKKPKESKQRILDAAIALFAQKGFAAVGVREIARKADVNIAMISYYFEGKVGMLKAVIEEFFGHYSQVFRDVDDERKSPEECVRILIRNVVNFVRENTEITMVAYNELPLELQGIAELKAEKISQMIGNMRGLIKRFGLDPDDIFQIGMIGPSLFSMIFTNFRIRPVLKKVFNFKFNDAYYERYTETIAKLFLYGISGIAVRKHKERGRKS